VKPQSINLTGPEVPVFEGEVVTFTCEADGAKPLPELRWYLQGMSMIMFSSYSNLLRVCFLYANTT